MAGTRRGAGSGTTVIQVDGLAVELSRKRVKNLNLRVRPDGSVCVSASPRVPLATIEEFVRSRRSWIVRTQAKLAERSHAMSLSCAQGAPLQLWGRPLTCVVAPVPAQGRWPRCSFEVQGGTLLCSADERIASTGERETSARTRMLDAWAQGLLKEAIAADLPRCEEVVRRHCAQWRVRHMSSRWGSCNIKSGTITLAAELVHHDRQCLRYVLVHELCHLWEPSHNERFHALMDEFYPTWRQVRRMLNGQQA